MKIKVTEIECTAEEIRQSNNIADGICTILRGVFNGAVPHREYNEDEDEDEEGDE